MRESGLAVQKWAVLTRDSRAKLNGHLIETEQLWTMRTGF